MLLSEDYKLHTINNESVHCKKWQIHYFLIIVNSSCAGMCLTATDKKQNFVNHYDLLRIIYNIYLFQPQSHSGLFVSTTFWVWQEWHKGWGVTFFVGFVPPLWPWSCIRIKNLYILENEHCISYMVNQLLIVLVADYWTRKLLKICTPIIVLFPSYSYRYTTICMCSSL